MRKEWVRRTVLRKDRILRLEVNQRLKKGLQERSEACANGSGESLARDVLDLSPIQADSMPSTKQFLAILAFAPFVLHAQKDVVSAYNANVDGDYLKAAEYIDLAIEDPKANIKEKTWRYRRA